MSNNNNSLFSLEKIKTLDQFIIDAKESAEHCWYTTFFTHTLTYDGESEERKQQREELITQIMEQEFHFFLAKNQAQRIHRRMERLIGKYSTETVLKHVDLSLDILSKKILAFDSNGWQINNLLEIPYLIEVFVRYELYLSVRDIVSKQKMNSFNTMDYAIILYYLYKHEYINVKSTSQLSKIGAVLYNALPMISPENFRQRRLGLLFRKANFKLKITDRDILLLTLSDIDPERIDNIALTFSEVMKLPKIAQSLENDYEESIDKHGLKGFKNKN